MSAAYLVALVKITSPDGWPEYRERVPQLVAEFGGRYLIRGGMVEVLEGSYDGRRLMVLEFPSMEAIRSFWNSPQYAAMKKLREGSGDLDVWAVPGA